MQSVQEWTELADQLARDLRTWLDSLGHAVAPCKPGPYRPWHWPPHPISFDYHIPISEWHGSAEYRRGEEVFRVIVARTPWGVFGRCEELAAEARGEDEEEMLDNLDEVCEPLIARQEEIGSVLGMSGRYSGSLRDLPALQLLKLFFASDRAIAHDAQREIETSGGWQRFGPALVEMLNERGHPYRRSAQWLALDLFEDLASYCPTPESQLLAIRAIRDLMWDAEDDFARTIYKAGVVLGGHVCTEDSANAILELMTAPSRIARRSAMHASFHLCEWMPSQRPEVLKALAHAAATDPEPMLRPYCAALAKDVEAEVIDHVAEPIFPDEP